MRWWALTVLWVAGCDPYGGMAGDWEDLGECPHPAGVIQDGVAHGWVFDGVWEGAPPEFTGVIDDASAWKDLQDAAPEPLPDINFEEESVLVASVFVEQACDVSTSGYAFRADEHGFAALDLTLASERATCDMSCGDAWYVVMLTMPVGWSSAVSSCVQESCGA